MKDCKNCCFYGKLADAHPEAECECMFVPDEYDNDGFLVEEPPCEREE